MAISAGAIWEVRNGGSDTVCGGSFDPTTSANMLTDGAATVATSATPNFTSASYNFVTGDTGAKLYIHAGTNWIPGWYTITWDGANGANLTAAAGSAQTKDGGLTTTAGCASVASPTGATWSIDYSQQNAAVFAYTDISAAGAGADCTSAAHPFGKQQVGNGIVLTGGTNVVAGYYTIVSVTGTTASLDAVGAFTGATSNGAGNLGGALATIGMAGARHAAGNKIYVQYHATAFQATVTTNNAAGGRFTGATGTVTNPVWLIGYGTTRGDVPTTRPTYQWGTAGGTNYLLTLQAFNYCRHFIFSGNSNTGRGLTTSTSFLYNVKITDFATFPHTVGSNVFSQNVEAGNNRDVSAAYSLGGSSNVWLAGCYIHDNAGPGMSISSGTVMVADCIFDTNTGAGISSTAASRIVAHNCDFYGNTGAGIDFTAQTNTAWLTNCIFETNGDHGIKLAAAGYEVRTANCAFFNNTTAKYSGITASLPYGNLKGDMVSGEIIPTATMFVNAAGGNFQKNTGGGYTITGTGYPQAFPGLTWANYPSVGAAVPQGSGGTPFGNGFV